MMRYLFLTDDAEIACFVEKCGVERIFVDLEIHGKVERQGGHDTVISRHRPEQISVLRDALSTSQLLVRTNPLHAGTASEIDYCIDSGAQLLMLPMFRAAREVEYFCRLVNSRVPVVPLVETMGAVEELGEVLKIDGVQDVHIGLNDLHLDLGLSFLFEVVANGVVERAADRCKEAGVPFGIGGIATLQGGLVPGELVLGEYVRIGSSSTILSRAFHQKATDLADLTSKVDLPVELAKLGQAYRRLSGRSQVETEWDRRAFQDGVSKVVALKAAA